MNQIKQGLTEFDIPRYMEEILTHNYCSSFMRMNIIKENSTYNFNYKLGNMTRLNIEELSTYEKLLLIRSIIEMSENARGYLIGGDSYLIEPELIYSVRDEVAIETLRILFYPDVKRLKLEYKLMQFAERIKNKSIKDERATFEQLRIAGECCDLNKIKLFLDKNIARAESRCMSKAG